MSFFTYLGWGIIILLDKISGKMKDWTDFNDSIYISHIIIVEYSSKAKELCIRGEDHLLLKHYEDVTFKDIKEGQVTRTEKYSRYLVEHYEKEKVPMWYMDQPNNYPRECHKPTLHDISASMF